MGYLRNFKKSNFDKFKTYPCATSKIVFPIDRKNKILSVIRFRGVISSRGLYEI